MEHLEWHKHAFLDANNKVIAVSIFGEDAHGSQLIQDIKEQLGAVNAVCCCDNGETDFGAYWINNRFTGIKHFPSFILDEETYEWIPPTPKPTDGKNYWWNEETISWIEIEDPAE
jgi:hypothetical protein